jgi:phage repressor protein C with HTH and peptisase S24 domain
MARQATLPADLRTQAGRLRWAREAAGFESSRAAARQFEWNENTYKSHEQGIRQAEGLKQRHAEKYARAFKVNLAWLLTGRGDPKAPEQLSQEEPALARQLLARLTGTR